MTLADVRYLAHHSAGEAPPRPIHRIGLPRALLFYRFGALFQTFLEVLGYDVILSRPTDAALLALGDELSQDECCLPSKIYLGHAAALADTVDALFVPSFGSANHREGFCTKFQSLPDLVGNTLRGRDLSLVTVFVDNASKPQEMKRSFMALGEVLGAQARHSLEAYRLACEAQASLLRQRQREQDSLISRLKSQRRVSRTQRGAAATGVSDETPLTILLAAHPYIAHDPYMVDPIVTTLNELGATVLYADAVDRASALKRSYTFSSTLPWVINRELIGAMMLLEPVIDGIVLVSAFSCGPDSMTDDVILRYLENRPLLNLIIDATSGVAGLQTRIESFIDILRFARKGGYHRDESAPAKPTG